MTIYESDLPGVGKKFEVELDGAKRLVIVTHNTGKREVFTKADEDADSEKQFELSDQLARKVGTILEGAYFQPVETERVETMLSDDSFIEWYGVEPASELAGKTVGGANVRERTGVSIVAIQRDGDVISPPTPETTIQGGDTVVVIGDRDSCSAFERLIGDPGAEGADEQ